MLALANAGSPMMWFGLLHLFVINAIIGTVESEIISRLKIPNKLFLVILGNYVSMFVGLYFIAPHFSSLGGNHDFWGGHTRLGEYHLNGFVVGMVSAYFTSLIIELPFLYYAVKGKLLRKKIWVPFFVANTATNIAMIAFYYLFTGIGEKW